MKVRYQADADLNENIVSGVQRRAPEIDFQTADELELANLPDPDVLELAAQEGRILVTHDRRTMPTHFGRFIENNKSPGLEAKFAAGNLSSKELEKALLNEYSGNIVKYGYTVVAYAIRKSIDNSPKYYLLYCTRHRDGVVLMNSFVREEEDELLRESTTKPDQPAFPSDEFDVVQQEIIQRRKELRRLLQHHLENVQKTTRGQIRNQFIFEHFGDFHDKDYNAVVKELIYAEKLQTGHGRKSINDDEPLTYTP